MIKSATPQRSEDHLAIDRIKRQISQAERMVLKASRELQTRKDINDKLLFKFK